VRLIEAGEVAPRRLRSGSGVVLIGIEASKRA
jgi:hypothetical protein